MKILSMTAVLLGLALTAQAEEAKPVAAAEAKPAQAEAKAAEAKPAQAADAPSTDVKPTEAGAKPAEASTGQAKPEDCTGKPSQLDVKKQEQKAAEDKAIANLGLAPKTKPAPQNTLGQVKEMENCK